MKFIESRLLAIRTSEDGGVAVLEFRETDGQRFRMTLSGVEKLLVNEFRQQNVVEDVVRWDGQGSPSAGLREVAFILACGVAEADASPQGAGTAEALIERTLRGELQVLELVPVYGAQVLASFKGITVEPSS